MAQNTHFSAAAHSWARSLLELAKERQVPLEPLAQELRDIRQVIDNDPSFREFLADPGVGETERFRLVDRVFRDHVSPLLSSFLGLLNSKNRLGLLADIAGAFDEALDEEL